MIYQIALLAFAYCLGSIPFGVLIGKRMGVDILSSGSGNIGATNVWRLLGPRAGSLAFLLDFLKGLIPAALGTFLFNSDWGFIIGLGAVMGHMLSPFLKFKGGKGIATAFGAAVGSIPVVALSAFSIFLACLFVTRYVSLSSILAMVAAVSFALIFHASLPVLVPLSALAIFIVAKHQKNIVRLLNGTENKFQFRSTPTSAVTVAERSEPESSAHPETNGQRAQ